MQAPVELGVHRLELVPDILLGPAGDLTPDPLPSGPKPSEIALTWPGALTAWDTARVGR